MNGDLLDVRNLKAYYRAQSGLVRAVDDVSIAVKRNEILGIAGESGCGKSTFALSVLRLLKPPGYVEGGEVVFGDLNLLELERKELKTILWKRISYIPQSSMNALNPVMRVEQQFRDAIRTHRGKVSKDFLRKPVEEALVSVGLAPEVAHMYPHELSGGMRQRVIISLAVVLGPELVVADEPTTALDVVVQRGILQLLRGIKNRIKSSVVMITHDMAAQAEVADRIALMYAGKMVEIGDVNALFMDPLHPYAQALISAVPSISDKRKLEGILGLPPDLRAPPPGCRFHPRCPDCIVNACDVDEPELVEVKKSRFVACHLYR